MTFPGSTMFPPLELTEYERRFNRAYDTPQPNGAASLPGVIRRIYKRQLGNPSTLEPFVRSAQMQITRRTRVFAFMFSGDVDFFDLRISTSGGTDFIMPDPANPDEYPIVSSLAPGSLWCRDTAIGLKTATAGVQKGIQTVPLIIEPNLVLSPNETLIFSTRAEEHLTEAKLWAILTISVYVWEFPGFGDV